MECKKDTYALVVTNTRDHDIEVSTHKTYDLALRTAVTDMLDEKHIQEQENDHVCEVELPGDDIDMGIMTVTTPASTYQYFWHITKINNA